MGQVYAGKPKDYLEKTIPELTMILQQHKWYFKLAKEKKVPKTNPIFKRICDQNKMVNAAIIILKKQSKIHNLKEDVGVLLHDYEAKWGKYDE